MKSMIAASLCILVAGSVHAAEPRSVEWFIMHEPDRMALDRHCDPRMLRTTEEIECNNARRARDFVGVADARLAAMRADVNGIGSIHSPLFWDQNSIARKNELRECLHPSSRLLAPDAATCRAVRISEARNP